MHFCSVLLRIGSVYLISLSTDSALSFASDSAFAVNKMAEAKATAQAVAVKRKKVVIIGSGPCGLGAAWRLQELERQGHVGADWVLFDEATTPGGSLSFSFSSI